MPNWAAASIQPAAQVDAWETLVTSQVLGHRRPMNAGVNSNYEGGLRAAFLIQEIDMSFPVGQKIQDKGTGQIGIVVDVPSGFTATAAQWAQIQPEPPNAEPGYNNTLILVQWFDWANNGNRIPGIFFASSESVTALGD
jgi:hypothetical protein